MRMWAGRVKRVSVCQKRWIPLKVRLLETGNVIIGSTLGIQYSTRTSDTCNRDIERNPPSDLASIEVGLFER